jgi:hypothetical protein
MSNVKRLRPAVTRWNQESMVSMFHGSLQAEFSELVRTYLHGAPKDANDMVRDEDFNACLLEGLEKFFAKHKGLPRRE